jgi:hypothetical protein
MGSLKYRFAIGKRLLLKNESFGRFEDKCSAFHMILKAADGAAFARLTRGFFCKGETSWKREKLRKWSQFAKCLGQFSRAQEFVSNDASAGAPR